MLVLWHLKIPYSWCHLGRNAIEKGCVMENVALGLRPAVDPFKMNSPIYLLGNFCCWRVIAHINIFYSNIWMDSSKWVSLTKVQGYVFKSFIPKYASVSRIMILGFVLYRNITKHLARYWHLIWVCFNVIYIVWPLKQPTSLNPFVNAVFNALKQL